MAVTNRLGVFRKARTFAPALQTSKSGGAASSANPQEVAQVAYDLYVKRGRVNGHDLEDWLKAEAIVRQRAAKPRS